MEVERIEPNGQSEAEVYRAAVAKVSAKSASSAEVERLSRPRRRTSNQSRIDTYRSANECNVLGPWVTYDTPLPKGLVVAANMYSQPETKYPPRHDRQRLDNGFGKCAYSYRAGTMEDRLREDIFIVPKSSDRRRLM